MQGNDFECDCYLAWMHKLRHEAKSIRVRTSLENFVCKLNSDPVMNSHLMFYEKSEIGYNDFFLDDKNQIRDYKDNTEDSIQDELDEEFVDEPKLMKKENEKTLLQIPVELLPCPAVVKSVTDRTYTYPSQNEAKDYRNLILTSQTSKMSATLTMLTFAFVLYQ
ncbi:unnamed protein product, partial [Iphiclides podalirius]